MGASETQEPAPVNLTPEGSEVVRRIDAVLEALMTFREAQVRVNEEVIERLDLVDQRFEKMDQRFEKVDQRFEKMDQRFEKMDQRFEKMDQRFEKMDQHLGYLRGAHAINAAKRNASLIADDMGYRVVSLVPRDVLIGLANMASATGKPENHVRSFREADLVMLARDFQGQPAYIAVEASFTVASNDINRAKRNAEYLHEFTGLPAKGAVAGVDIASGREQNAKAVGVHCYRIPVRQLEVN